MRCYSSSTIQLRGLHQQTNKAIIFLKKSVSSFMRKQNISGGYRPSVVQKQVTVVLLNLNDVWFEIVMMHMKTWSRHAFEHWFLLTVMFTKSSRFLICKRAKVVFQVNKQNNKFLTFSLNDQRQSQRGQNIYELFHILILSTKLRNLIIIGI